jgi:hypothetical protein
MNDYTDLKTSLLQQAIFKNPRHCLIVVKGMGLKVIKFENPASRALLGGLVILHFYGMAVFLEG